MDNGNVHNCILMEILYGPPLTLTFHAFSHFTPVAGEGPFLLWGPGWAKKESVFLSPWPSADEILLGAAVHGFWPDITTRERMVEASQLLKGRPTIFKRCLRFIIYSGCSIPVVHQHFSWQCPFK
jgi:hypothetical protein